MSAGAADAGRVPGCAFRIVGGGVRRVALPLRRPLATAHGTLRARSLALLVLETSAGARGVGEASPLRGFHRESAGDAAHALRTWLTRAREVHALPLAAWLARLDADAALPPTARGAAECALLDAASRSAGLPLADLLCALRPVSGAAHTSRTPRTAPVAPRLSALVGEHAPDAVERAVRDACVRGFRAVKLKLPEPGGVGRARLAAALAGLGPDARLRIDANGGWSAARAEALLARLDPARVEWVEQPLPAAALAPLAALRRNAAVPIALDESVVTEADAERAIAASAADVLVVKPAACGGARAALRIAQRACEAELGVAFTAFLDGAVGRALAGHVACAWRGPQHDAGLATGGLLARDLAAACDPSGPRLARPVAPGLGVQPVLPAAGGGP